MNPVATGFCSDVQYRIAYACGFAKKDLVMSHYAECKRVDEWIQGISIVEGDLPADSSDTKRVSVMGYAGHNPSKQGSVAASMLRMIQRSKPQTVHGGNRTCSHREDIPQDPSHSGCRSLKRFYERGMIV